MCVAADADAGTDSQKCCVLYRACHSTIFFIEYFVIFFDGINVLFFIFFFSKYTACVLFIVSEVVKIFHKNFHFVFIVNVLFFHFFS